MLGVEGYGSGSESEGENDLITRAPARLPQKALKAKRPPKKITIGLPNLPPPEAEDEDEFSRQEPAPKKRRLSGGAGASSLLSMLPAPTKKAAPPKPPQRVLGDGQKRGLVFNTTRPAESSFELPEPISSKAEKKEDEPSTTSTDHSALFSFLPPSLTKGRPNISLEEGPSKLLIKPSPKAPEPAVDFFSLGTVPPSSSKNPVNSVPSTSIGSSLPAISSAPEVPQFEIPEPTPNDAYPGYYQLPTGTWAAYEQEYYAKFMKKWQDEYNAYVRALEKGKIKGFEDLDDAAIQEVDAAKEMERARKEVKEREDRKAMTTGAGGDPAQPNIKFNPSKLSGIARSRHQLTTLLNEAYNNREALEERIAEGRRNRKEAGNKYGLSYTSGRAFRLHLP
ncbi:hypothetical protein BDN72DRAFT_234807 [Pluteus cervinus]|uniref:Uncharacterized protein n=1 Tax=Pluteus cervinus TaxID=181527 RepID=A0ACD3BH97_9AGAR|nr:hypothetical protein BDN72DRAFT_234807 [Pluteus cervinus]